MVTDTQKRIIIVSLAIVLVLTSIYYEKIPNKIDDFINPDLYLELYPLEDTITNYNGKYSNYERVVFLSENGIVPDYKAVVSYDFFSVKERKAIFKFNINDVGIEKLNIDTFYYVIYVVSPQNKVEYYFPKHFEEWHYVGQSPRYFSYEGMNSVLFIPRETLIHLRGNYLRQYNSVNLEEGGGDIYFTFEMDRVGEWDIYVFVYDEEYLDRITNKFIKNDYSYGAYRKGPIPVGYGLYQLKFDGNSLSSDALKPDLSAYGILSVLLSVVGIYALLDTLIIKRQEKVFSFISSYKWDISFLVLILFFVLILMYILK